MRLEVFPRFSINLELVEFNAVDLVHGFYQIRFRLKQTSSFTYELKCEQKPSTSLKNRPQVYHQTAVSRPIKVAFSEQSVELLDVFQISVDLSKRYDKIESCNLEIQLELWYLDPESKPLLENYVFVSKRLVTILLKPDRSIHNHRHVFFEYFSFSAVSLTIHSSVTGVFFNQTKSLDTPLNDKLRSYHTNIVTRLLSSCLSMQNFIKNYAYVLTSPLKIACVDVDKKVGDLQHLLEEAELPWLQFQDDLKQICDQLKQLFAQLVQLFNFCRQLSFALLEEFDQKRIKRFAEGFMFVEDTVQSLLKPELNLCSRIFELIKKSGYLSKLPKTPVKVEGTDVEASNITLILEHRYLPAGATVFSPNDEESDDTVSQQKTERTNTESVVPSTEPSLSDRLTSRRSSAEKFQFVASMCFPINRLPSSPDDSYGCPKSDYLNPNAHNRWTNRRMTDPGAGIHNESSDLMRLTTPETSDVSPRETLKSRSVTDISVKDTHENSELVSCKSKSSSADSVTRSIANLSFKNVESKNSSTDDKVLITLLDQDRVVFVEQKEALKQRLWAIGYKGLMYSDLKFFNWRPYFSTCFNEAIERRNIEFVHLVVFVHGLEGTSEDLSAYRNYLRIALPEENFAFLLSETNQTETWSDFNNMAENLLQELLRFVSRMPRLPNRISMITHSLGGLIVRTMCGLENMKPLLPKLYTLVSLNSPHLGLLYNQRAANWGISILQFWKNSTSLEQLTMRDAATFQNTFLYKISRNGAFGFFKNVLLIGSYMDVYVPLHSALIEPCKMSMNDPSAQGTAYNEMLMQINESIISSPRHTTLIKYTVAHSLSNISRAQQMTGRANHIAVVDDDTFIEKLLLVSAAKYFQ